MQSYYAVLFLDTIKLTFSEQDTKSWVRRFVSYVSRGWTRHVYHKTGTYSVNIQQPSKAMIEKIELWCKQKKMKVTGFDIALDILADDIEGFRKWVDKHKLLKNRRSRASVIVEQNIAYTGPAKSSKNLIVYSDKPAKLMPDYQCVHIELRLRGTRALKRAGVWDNGNDHLAIVPHQLLDIFSKRVQFYDFDIGKLERKLEAILLAKYTAKQAIRTACHARGKRDEWVETGISAGAVRKLCTMYNLKEDRLLSRLALGYYALSLCDSQSAHSQYLHDFNWQDTPINLIVTIP